MGVSPKSAALVNTHGASSRGVQADGTYCIYASTSGKKEDEFIKVLAAGSPTDQFVASLNTEQVIVLAATPAPTASLDDSDPTKQWLQKLDSSASGSLTLDNTTQKNIESFEITLSDKWPLTFSSASDVLLFTFGTASDLIGGDTGARIDPPGINTGGYMLACGLHFSETSDISNATVEELFNYAGLADMVPLLPSGLAAVGVALTKSEAAKSPKRNALWFAPKYDMQSTIRLQFQLSNTELLQDILTTTLKGFTLTSADAICKKKAVLAETTAGNVPVDQGSVAFAIECSVKATDGAAVSMTAGIEFQPSQMTLTFMFLSADPLTGLLKWLASLLDDSELESFVTTILNKKEGSSTSLISAFTLRRMTIGLDTSDPQTSKLSEVAFDIEISANFGRTGTGANDPVVFLISYNWDAMLGGFGTLTGQLWNNFTNTEDSDLLPYEEVWTILEPVTKSPAPSIQIVSLVPGQTITSIPDTLPSEITRAYVAFSADSFAVGGTVSARPLTPGSAPQPYLGDVVVDASFSWGQSTSFTLKASISAGIEPSATSKHPEPALLTGSLDYDSSNGNWDLQATLSGLYASTLVEFFDDDAKDHVGPLIDSIAIDSLHVGYKYTRVGDTSTAKSSEFTIEGDMLVASLKLSLTFIHKNGGFQFSAALNPKDNNAKIGDVLLGLVGPDDEIELPDFVSDMVLVGNDKNALSFNVAKKDTSFQLVAEMNIGKLRLAFAQLHGVDWKPEQPSKRLIQAAIDGFPNITIEVPLIGTLQQPLDELYFLWVQAPMPVSQTPKPGEVTGFTRKDLQQINSSFEEKILVKDKFKQPGDTDMLVEAGCHFAVVIISPTGEKSCLLDYGFMRPKIKASPPPPPPPGGQVAKVAEDADNDDGGPSAQEPYKKTAGSLSISNVGLKYKDKKLAFMFDAKFEMGPIGFTLIGFSLQAQFKTLDELPTFTANIDGLSAAFEKPPLVIAGIIRHGNTGGIDYYAGGLIVGWTVYQFQAAGFYGVVTPQGGGGPFKSVFVFAKLDGPLVTLEFAEISGVCGGFGYNSSVRVPTVDQISEFPFIASASLSNATNAMEALQKLTDPGPTGWFKPLDKTYWAAVGMKVDAFKMLSFNAVVVVQFGEAIKLGLFALVIADIPTAASPVKLAHVELGISAVADFQYGTLKIEAQLSPRSFILHESCHLTGGAGLYYWFDAPEADKSIIGDFVYTLGGYHQAFAVPTGYPNPPRLGISWSLGNNLSISGQAYFAITPKACMAGGRLHASFSAGPLEAWFDAFADFLINYKPFYFNAQAGLAVGIAFKMKVWFIHIRISAEIGAQLYLWGPPLAGRVHVDFWIMGFDINFGQSEARVPAVTLAEFYQLVLQASPNASSASRALLTMSAEGDETAEEALAASPAKNEGHNFLAQSGLLNPGDKPNKQPNEPWIVRAGTFSFVVGCKMAITSFKNAVDGPAILTGDDVYSKPMQLTSPVDSTLVVTVQQDGVPDPDDGWRYEEYRKSVPKALWGQYTSDDDPKGGRNNIKDLLNSDDTTLSLLMGVQMTAPKAQIAPDPFPAFDVADASLQTLPSERAFPTIAPVDPTWAPDKPTGGAEQYKAVLDTWVAPGWGTGQDGQGGFVEKLAQKMKWADPESLKSIAGIPDRLKSGFMNMYVAAPLMTK